MKGCSLKMLSNLFSAVETVRSPGKASEILKKRAESKERPFGAIFLDWTNPDINELEILGKQKTRPNFSDAILIVMFTASKWDEVTEITKELKADGFITKPITRRQLADTVSQALGYSQNSIGRDETAANSQRDFSGIQGAKILLVENDPINQQVAGEYLEQKGLIVEVAVNGIEAVKKVSKTPYDLVFMDIQMPKMDGLEATGEIRANGFSELPIIAMTAQAFAEDIENSLKAGMNDHLSKPVNPEILNDVLLKWIPRKNRKIPKTFVNKTADAGNSTRSMPNLEGLDIESGLNYTGASPEKYLSFLYRFVVRNKDLAATVHDLRVKGDIKQAGEKAHTIKGTSSILGVQQLAEVSSNLEIALRENNVVDSDRLFGLFKKELERICSELLDYFEKNADIKAN